MGRSPCYDESGLKKGPWTPEEDQKLVKYIQKHGHSSWRALPKLAGLNRCGKSCRLRWTNYLRPDIKRGKFSQEEEQTILNLHSVLGNKWSAIASHLPGRTDNEIKNFWNTHLKKKLIQMGFDPMTHRPRTDILSTLPHLIAQANLKELIDHRSVEEHAMRLQAEAVQMAKFQYLQYLLQPQSHHPPASVVTGSNYIATTSAFSNMETFNLLNSLASIKDSLVSGSITQLDLSSTTSPPGLMFSQGENSPWLPSSSSTPSPPSVAPPLLTQTNSSINTTMGDASSTNSSFGGEATTVWQHLLLDDPLFHEIA
ncbi:hypothetical protein GH714_018417 [Hevea brasiliensis]|uniref:Uncharacterized protein n=1 Tax=Hevea brasiliensis TaxID=3981 RepID=A0A6A6K998_HEVBR|nr:hypothetical protein GH714_018417 [Hevea brasiliensis]